MHMKLMNERNVVERRAGFVFKDLKVSGKGSAVQLQANVGSAFMMPFRLREAVQSGPEKTILKSFDGVLKSGEMLIVLGRPGSGCSTLLKTITGELHGLDMKKESTLHYNGRSTRGMLLL